MHSAARRQLLPSPSAPISTRGRHARPSQVAPTAANAPRRTPTSYHALHVHRDAPPPLLLATSGRLRCPACRSYPSSSSRPIPPPFLRSGHSLVMYPFTTDGRAAFGVLLPHNNHLILGEAVRTRRVSEPPFSALLSPSRFAVWRHRGTVRRYLLYRLTDPSPRSNVFQNAPASSPLVSAPRQCRCRFQPFAGNDAACARCRYAGILELHTGPYSGGSHCLGAMALSSRPENNARPSPRPGRTAVRPLRASPTHLWSPPSRKSMGTRFESGRPAPRSTLQAPWPCTCLCSRAFYSLSPAASYLTACAASFNIFLRARRL